MSKPEPSHVETFKSLLTKLLKGYKFDIEGLYRSDGTVLPLPRESSLIGKVVEVTIKSHLDKKVLNTKGLEFVRGGERSYPDLTLFGPATGGHRYAIDVKCVRRDKSGKRTESAMGLATFDANYFRHPDESDPNIMAPYNSYDAHLVLVALYDYEDATARKVEPFVVEKWRIASRKRASGTRCYVAAVTDIDKLRKEQGDFDSEDAYHDYWRGIPVPEKKRRTRKTKES